VALFEFDKKHMQIAPREGPPERFGGPLISGLECHHGAPQIGKAAKIARCEQLALDNGEVHLELVSQLA
jgi:hypothetical protein